MKLKTVEVGGKTYAEIIDGKPAFVGDDDKDVAFDVPGMHSKITALNAESKGHREAKEATETKLKAFEGITDPAAALKALETVKNIDDKKLIDAGEVEKVKAAAVKGYEEKLVALNKTHTEELGKLTKERDDLRSGWNQEKIAVAFTGAAFVKEKLIVPADIVQAQFGSSFKVEDGKIVGYDKAGNKLMSKTNPGDPAGFEEAIQMVVDAYPQRDAILKGSGHTGTDKRSGREGGGDGPSFKGGELGGTRQERTASIAKRFNLPVS